MSLKRIAALAGFIGFMVLVPVTYSNSGRFQSNTACADRLCCREIGSICDGQIGWKDTYYSGNGTCE